MNKKIDCIINKGKAAKNAWENDETDFFRVLCWDNSFSILID